MELREFKHIGFLLKSNQEFLIRKRFLWFPKIMRPYNYYYSINGNRKIRFFWLTHVKYLFQIYSYREKEVWKDTNPTKSYNYSNYAFSAVAPRWSRFLEPRYYGKYYYRFS